MLFCGKEISGFSDSQSKDIDYDSRLCKNQRFLIKHIMAPLFEKVGVNILKEKLNQIKEIIFEL